MAFLRIAQTVTNGNMFLCLKALLDPSLAEQGRFWSRFFCATSRVKRNQRWL